MHTFRSSSKALAPAVFLSAYVATASAASATTTISTPAASWGANVQTLYHAPALKVIGTQWARLTLGWPQIEAISKNIYNWSDADKTISYYLASGMSIVCVLSVEKMNPLYAQDSSNKARVSQAIARWMGAVAQRYKGKGIIWEIGNEPEVFPMGGYWNDPDTYTQMARLSASAIKQADPTAKTAALSLGWMDKGYAASALANGLLNDGTIDYLSFHGYDRPTMAPESGLVDDVGWLRSAATAATPAGMKIPEIIDSETGYALAAFQSPKPIASWRTIVYTEETQAAYLARHFIEEIYIGLPISVWYKDMNGEDGFSLYYGDETNPAGLRPMGHAFQTLSALLPGNPASLKNISYAVSIESLWQSPTGGSQASQAPQLHERSFLVTGSNQTQTLIIAVWNSVEAFDGQILASRTFSNNECIETWRDVASTDPVNVPTKLTVGLGTTAIKSIRELSLPNGAPLPPPTAASPNTNSRGVSSFLVTASPMPTIIAIAIASVPNPPSELRITR